MVHFQVFQKGGVTVKGLIYICIRFMFNKVLLGFRCK